MDKDKPLTANRNFGRYVLDALENMRERRVKQLASRIVEAALGIGRMPGKKGASKRPIERVDEPRHAVVIENLAHYRPDETRSRRENRRLMRWISGKLKTYLSESCELHGLFLMEVSASYTSRQDSHTGAPGLRCEDVPLKEFLESTFWQDEISRAEKKPVKTRLKTMMNTFSSSSVDGQAGTRKQLSRAFPGEAARYLYWPITNLRPQRASRLI